jgi:hypothetical protein
MEILNSWEMFLSIGTTGFPLLLIFGGHFYAAFLPVLFFSALYPRMLGSNGNP